LLESTPEFGAAAPNINVDPTEQWRDGVEEADFPEEEEVVIISLSEYFPLD
jgi:hypothetical protein